MALMARKSLPWLPPPLLPTLHGVNWLIMGTKMNVSVSPLSINKENKWLNTGASSDNSQINPTQFEMDKDLLAVKEEIDWNIETISSKLGYLYVTQSTLVGSVKFQTEFIEKISSHLTEVEQREKVCNKKIKRLITWSTPNQGWTEEI